MRTPKARTTLFNDVMYRSRTEARVAAFLTAARIDFEYEPEMYGDYKPDFVLRDIKHPSSEGVIDYVTVEVKPLIHLADKTKFNRPFYKQNPTFIHAGGPDRNSQPQLHCVHGKVGSRVVFAPGAAYYWGIVKASGAVGMNAMEAVSIVDGYDWKEPLELFGLILKLKIKQGKQYDTMKLPPWEYTL